MIPIIGVPKFPLASCLRLGCIVAPPTLVDAFIAARHGIDTFRLQRIVCRLLGAAEYCSAMRRLLSTRSQKACSAWRAHGAKFGLVRREALEHAPGLDPMDDYAQHRRQRWLAATGDCVIDGITYVPRSPT